MTERKHWAHSRKEHSPPWSPHSNAWQTMSRKGGVGGGCKHITQNSTSNHQSHLTSPYIKLRSSQCTEF